MIINLQRYRRLHIHAYCVDFLKILYVIKDNLMQVSMIVQSM